MMNQTRTTQLQSNLDAKLSEAVERVRAAADLQALYDVKVSFAGKQGFLSEIMKEMAKLPKEEKPLFGKEVNRIKEAFEAAHAKRETELKESELQGKIARDGVDVSL